MSGQTVQCVFLWKIFIHILETKFCLALECKLCIHGDFIRTVIFDMTGRERDLGVLVN